MTNAPEITFSAKRCANGYHPVSDGQHPGGYFGGQRVWKLVVRPTFAEAVAAAEALFWNRLEATQW